MALDDIRHPDAERLAEYADDVLDVEVREEVERHLADCAECRAIVAETMAFLQANPATVATVPAPRVIPFRSRRWVTGVAAGLAVAAALVLAVRVARPEWASGLFRQRGDRPELQELIAAVANEPTRPVEGRLTGGFKYAPPPSPTRGPGDREVSPDVKIAAAKIEKLAEDHDTPENEAALGVAYAALGDLDKAIGALENAAARAPDGAHVQSDLSAVYLARAVRRARAEDLPKALAAAERALRVKPLLSEALYNRALALERLHLDDAARKAWEEYRRGEPMSQWIHEVETRSKPQTRDWTHDWEMRRDRLEHLKVDDAALAEIAADFPEELESFLEDVLVARWAASARAGWDDAAAYRLLGRRIAAAVSRRAHDRFAVDLVAAETPAASDAYELWRQGRELYEADRVKEAAVLFARAGSALPVTHPLREWTRFYEGVTKYYARDFKTAVSLFDAVAADAAHRDHRVILGRTEWMLGLIAGVQGDYGSAIRRYQHAAAIFDAAGCLEQLAKVNSLLADVYVYVGDSHALWEHEVASLTSYGRLANRRWRQSMLDTATLRLLREGYPEAALQFEHAAVAAALASREPVAATQALLYRCRILRQLNLRASAVLDLESARQWRAQVSDASMGAALDFDLTLESASLGGDETAAALQAAVQRATSSDLKARLPYLLLGYGRVLRQAGKLSEAERALRTAIEVARSVAFSASEGHDVAQLDQFGNVVRELVDLQFSAGRTLDALETAEWSRAPFLRRVLAVDDTALATVQARLPLDTVLLHYQPLLDAVACWRMEMGRVQAFRLDIRPDLLQRQIAEYLRVMHIPRATARRETLGRMLYDELLAPVLGGVPASSRLGFIADGDVAQLPFASLVTPSKRFLIEDRVVTIVPSASVFAALGRRHRGTSPDDNLLVIGVSDDPVMGALPAAVREVAQIALLYERRDVITDVHATPARFLRDAPRYSIVHVASHAVANPDFPDLSRVVLASSDAGESFLFARDIASMRFTGPATAVLSGCDTAVGRISPGEGALSLARAFLAAGATQVVASLWKADDGATAELMITFHRSFRSTHDAASALRQAQIGLIRSGAAVDQWAGFEMIGARAESHLQEAE